MFSVDAASGALAPVAGSPFPAGLEPRSVVADPTGKHLYVGNTVSNDISAFVIDTATGFLAPMSGSPYPVGQVPFGIEIDKMGKLVYVPNSGSNSVSVFSIDSSGGLQNVQTMSTPGNAYSVASM